MSIILEYVYLQHSSKKWSTVSSQLRVGHLAESIRWSLNKVALS